MREWVCVFRHKDGTIRRVYIAAATSAEAWLAQKTHGRAGEKLVEVTPLPQESAV